jgi:hypothetical protein
LITRRATPQALRAGVALLVFPCVEIVPFRTDLYPLSGSSSSAGGGGGGVGDGVGVGGGGVGFGGGGGSQYGGPRVTHPVFAQFVGKQVLVRAASILSTGLGRIRTSMSN